MPKNPCPGEIRDASGDFLSEAEAAKLIDKLHRRAANRAAERGMNYDDAIREIAGEMQSNERLAGELNKRNALLNIRARRSAKAFVKRFGTPGEGLLALLEGSAKKIPGARLSVDYQTRAVHHMYLGRFVAELEQADLWRTFKSGKLAREIYIETGEMHEGGTPGITKSAEAMKIAKVLHDVTWEMVSRQNRAGAFIDRIPGYVVRQTHDQSRVRDAGGVGLNNKARSLAEWASFTMPLLDTQKTFDGADPAVFMKNVHEGLFTGTHGPEVGEAEIMIGGYKSNLSGRQSSRRILHFKDAESAYKYNQRFGIRDLTEQVFADILYRARSIALMERLGPNALNNWDQLLRELADETRLGDDAARKGDSLRDWRLQTALDVVSGQADIPVNYTLSRSMAIVRSTQILSKMGSTLLSAITDKVFLNAELAFQGISLLDRAGAQISGLAKRGPHEKRMLRLMGVAMDSIIGNVSMRYTAHTTTSGVAHRLQKKLFDVNLMNWWTDVHKSTAAELMSAHLGEHSSTPFNELPGELSNVLSLYNITPLQWDAIRSTAWTPEGQDTLRVTPDQLSKITDDQIDTLLVEAKLKSTTANRSRMRDDLETSLRTYYVDRVDYAIPTPGAQEKRWTTMGTRPGTPLGEAVRLIMMFKSYPITIMTKILGREVYGGGSKSLTDWFMHDHRGKFNTAMLIGMTMIAGYLSGAIRDALKGRTPKKLVNEDGFDERVLFDAAARGGGMGVLGDYLFNEYDRGTKSALSSLAGPVIGQVDPVAETITSARRGEYAKALDRSGKLIRDNTPFINLFYTRPVMDYFIFWNLQEMLDPGSLKRSEDNLIRKKQQDFFLRPSDSVK